VAVLVAAVGSTATAAADEPTLADKETARTLFRTGDERYRRGDYRGALDAFAAADAIMKVPTTGLELGRTQAKLGLLIEARATLRRVASMAPVPDEPTAFAQARAEAAALFDDLGRLVPALTVNVSGPGGVTLAAEVRVDDEIVPSESLGHPRRINPGAHRVVAVADGYRRAEAMVELREGESRALDLALEPQPDGDSPVDPPGAASTAPALLPTTAWVAFGVGAAALVAGVVTGAVTLAQAGDLEDACPDKRCPAGEEEALDRTVALSHASTTLFVVAGVGAALGVVAVLVGDDQPPAAAWQLTPAGARASF
jgi:hypothetical protein